jgi:hypothetical protein
MWYLAARKELVPKVLKAHQEVELKEYKEDKDQQELEVEVAALKVPKELPEVVLLLVHRSGEI